MTATGTTTDKEVDPREVRGGSKDNVVDHIVRIVVVRSASHSTVARESDGPGHSHGLTNDELKAAEDELKEKAAPPPDGTSGPGESSNAKSAKPKNMFEALKPTDIVVVGRAPASVRKLKEGPRLRVHDDRNRDTVLRVWTDSDTVEYQCDERFEIVKMERAGWKIYDAPENPFKRSGEEPPYRAEQRQGPTGGKLIWSWKSGQVPATANNQQYKMTFKIFDEKGNEELVDPDVVCGDPPPLP